MGSDPRVSYWTSMKATPDNEPRLAALKAHCRRGIPPQLRPALWLWLSGGAAMQAAAPAGTYKQLCQPAGLPNETLYAIDQDAAGRATTRRVLIALFKPQAAAAASPATVTIAAAPAKAATGAPAVAALQQPYPRGLASLVAFVVAVQGATREEEAYWTLAALLQRRLFPYACCAAGTGAAGSAAAAATPAYALGCRTEARVMEALAAKKLPALAAHLEKLETGVAAVMGPWVPCMFTSVLPPEASACLLDCAMLEGSKVLQRAGLALMKMHSSTILVSGTPWRHPRRHPPPNGILSRASMPPAVCAHRPPLRCLRRAAFSSFSAARPLPVPAACLAAPHTAHHPSASMPPHTPPDPLNAHLCFMFIVHRAPTTRSSCAACLRRASGAWPSRRRCWPWPSRALAA